MENIRHMMHMFLFSKGEPPLVPAIPSRETLPRLISVITPSLNQGVFIEACIESVRKQTYPHYEHIVVDGDSSDNTREVLGRYKHLRWISERDRGQSHALNKGIRMARGEYVFWLNSDDELMPGIFQDVVTAFDQANGPDVIVYGFQIIDEEGRYVGEKLPQARMKWMDGRFSPFDCFPTPAICFRRDIVTKNGGFEEGNHFVMDYEFLLRMRAQNANVAFRDFHAVRFRTYATQKSGTRNLGIRKLWMYKVNRRYWGKPWELKWWVYWYRARELMRWSTVGFLEEALVAKRQIRAFLLWLVLTIQRPTLLMSRTYWGYFLRTLTIRGPVRM